MGYIIDFELTAPPPARREKRAAKVSTIADLTPLVPRAVAEAAHEEASVWLHTKLPISWIAELTAKADTVAMRNRQFRRLVQRNGNAGRDWLWAFMRHWLSAKILAHDRRLHRRLPAGYSVGTRLCSQDQSQQGAVAPSLTD